jgi:hypothetical protein
MTRTWYWTCGAALAAMFVAGEARAGLLAFYPFEGNANDVVNGFNGTLSGGVTLASGFEGQSYDFDGTTGSILTPININPAPLPALTFGAWINSDTLSGGPPFAVISHDDGGFDRTLTRLGTQMGAFSGSGAILSGSAISAGTWVFVAAVYDQGAGTVRLHVDGLNFSEPGTLGASVHNATIGAGQGGAGLFWDGRIDNVFFYDEALTIAEIEAIRLGGSDAILGVQAIPEPSSLALLAVGLVSAAGYGRRRRGHTAA